MKTAPASQNRKQRWLAAAALIVLMAAGLAIRLYDLTDPPLDFNVPVQIHSALIARGFYAQAGGNFTDWERGQAVMLGANEVWIEPPIVESLAALGYRLAGGADLWIPRLFSILFWMVGAAALYALSRRIGGVVGGLAAVAYTLILPFGVVASRSFQSDILMMGLFVCTLWALLRWVDASTWRNAILAGALGGLAILTKQTIVFMLACAALGLTLTRFGFKRTLHSGQVWLVAGLMLLPAAVYNVYGIWVAGFLRGQYAMRFFPQLFIDPAFYIRWANKIDSTVGLSALLLGLLGWLLLKDKSHRALLGGLFAGYVIYGLVFAHHISTHDYYSLPLIPVIALGLGVLAQAVTRELHLNRWETALAVLLVAAGLLYPLYITRQTLKKADFRSEPQTWAQASIDMGRDGSVVVGLFDDYGARLIYWGYIMPAVWPTTADQQVAELAGQAAATGSFAERTAGKSFFVVTDLAELSRQPELQKALQSYPVFRQGQGYIIYDLRKAQTP
jgi:4-amino-4-deoxy-L-arabinose transferase-like glycosyltransferase